MANFIKEALDKVLTYETLPAVVKYMELQSAIGNPPWKKKEEESKINFLYLYILCNGVDNVPKEHEANLCFTLPR